MFSFETKNCRNSGQDEFFSYKKADTEGRGFKIAVKNRRNLQTGPKDMHQKKIIDDVSSNLIPFSNENDFPT
jgi:hypothetical protein